MLGAQLPIRCQGLWTQYYDRDNPSGNGDYETLTSLRNDHPDDICENPIAVDGREVSEQVHYSQTGQILTVDRDVGLSCVNSQQRNGRCLDYEVRFCCPPSSK